MSIGLKTTGIQKFEVEHDRYSCNSITFRIDFNHPEAKKMIKNMYEYEYGKLHESDQFENILYEWLQLAASTCFQLAVQEGTFEVVQLSDQDGFCQMDGSFGITIDSYLFDVPCPSDFDVISCEEDLRTSEQH